MSVQNADCVCECCQWNCPCVAPDNPDRSTEHPCPDCAPTTWSRFRYWVYCWYKTLTLPRHIKRALREPIDPDDFVEVERPSHIDGSGAES